MDLPFSHPFNPTMLALCELFLLPLFEIFLRFLFFTVTRPLEPHAMFCQGSFLKCLAESTVCQVMVAK